MTRLLLTLLALLAPTLIHSSLIERQTPPVDGTVGNASADYYSTFYTAIDNGTKILLGSAAGKDAKITYVTASQPDFDLTDAVSAQNLTSLSIKANKPDGKVVLITTNGTWTAWSYPTILDGINTVQESFNWTNVASDMTDITSLITWNELSADFVSMSIFNTSTVPGLVDGKPNKKVPQQVYWSFLYPRNGTEEEGKVSIHPAVMVGDEDGTLIEYVVKWLLG